MEETTSEPLFVNNISRGGIVVEFLENLPLTLTTKDYPLPGSNLKYEYASFISEHRPVASVIFRWFRSVIGHCNVQNGGELVHEMVEVFRRYNDELTASLREYVLSEGIVFVSYRVQIDDSQMIKEVLDLVYENWSSFRSLHLSGILKDCYFRTTQRRTNENSNHPDFLTFYLEHARRLHLEYNGVRFIDVSVYGGVKDAPVFIAADFSSWRPLLRYLQFGAKFENVRFNPMTSRQGVHFALTITLRNLITHLWFLMVKPALAISETDPKSIEEYCNNLTRRVCYLCHTLKIILRAVTFLQHDALEFNIRDISNQRVENVNSRLVVNHPTVHLMVPTLNQRYRCPIQLQHSCRCSIRNRLNENWQLPAGINDLPIPNKMKKYLNLLSD